METLIKDLRYAGRSFLKRPGFLVIAVATLALGIGATTAMFTVVNSVLLRPLQFPEPDRIVLFYGINPRQGITQSNMSMPDIVDWQKQTSSFEQIAGFFSGGLFLTAGDETERVRGAGVSSEFFPLFKTNPIQGRTLQAADSQQGVEPVIVISYALWQRRFGAATNVVNSKVTLNGKAVTIVGVMPAGFNYPDDSEAWTAFSLNDPSQPRDNRFISVVTRLKPGVSMTQAQTEMDTINHRLAQNYGETNNGWTVQLVELRESLVGELRTSLLILLGAVAFVLLIACANVANLMLARAVYRQKEIALRTALGASRRRIVRQLLTESMMLSVVSGVIGFTLSLGLVRLLIAINPPNSPRVEEIGIDWRVFGVTLAVAVFAGLLFGLFPAILGIYGVTSYYVTQRTHEIGVRMALGAQIVDVLKLVLSRAMTLALIGIGIGVVGAIALTRYLTTLLFGVKPIDVVTFVGVAVMLAIVVLVACLVPARRATKIDPLEALR
jgi:putative ABC transport system permease protein